MRRLVPLVSAVAVAAVGASVAAGAGPAPPKPFADLVAPHHLRWGVVTNGSSFTRSFRISMGAKVTFTVRGAWSGGTVSVRIADAAKRTVLDRVYSQQQRPTGTIPQTVRGRAGRWTFTFNIRGPRGGPFLLEASG